MSWKPSKNHSYGKWHEIMDKDVTTWTGKIKWGFNIFFTDSPSITVVIDICTVHTAIKHLSNISHYPMIHL